MPTAPDTTRSLIKPRFKHRGGQSTAMIRRFRLCFVLASAVAAASGYFTDTTDDYEDQDISDNRLRLMLEPGRLITLNETRLKLWRAGEGDAAVAARMGPSDLNATTTGVASNPERSLVMNEAEVPHRNDVTQRGNSGPETVGARLQEVQRSDNGDVTDSSVQDDDYVEIAPDDEKPLSGSVVIVVPGDDDQSATTTSRALPTETVSDNLLNLILNLTVTATVNEKNTRAMLRQLRQQRNDLQALKTQSDAIYQYVMQTTTH